MFEFLFWFILTLIVIFGFVVFRGAPYVPSHHSEVVKAFSQDLYPVGENDVVVDVGSGDGIILRLAAQSGARSIGFELNPVLVLISRFLARGKKNIKTVLADFWLTDLPYDTTLVYAFTVTRDIDKMANKLQNEATRLQRPLYFISYGTSIKNKTKLKQLGAHHLYRFEPLQTRKA